MKLILTVTLLVLSVIASEDDIENKARVARVLRQGGSSDLNVIKFAIEYQQRTLRELHAKLSNVTEHLIDLYEAEEKHHRNLCRKPTNEAQTPSFETTYFTQGPDFENINSTGSPDEHENFNSTGFPDEHENFNSTGFPDEHENFNSTGFPEIPDESSDGTTTGYNNQTETIPELTPKQVCELEGPDAYCDKYHICNYQGDVAICELSTDYVHTSRPVSDTCTEKIDVDERIQSESGSFRLQGHFMMGVGNWLIDDYPESSKYASLVVWQFTNYPIEEEFTRLLAVSYSSDIDLELCEFDDITNRIIPNTTIALKPQSIPASIKLPATDNAMIMIRRADKTNLQIGDIRNLSVYSCNRAANRKIKATREENRLICENDSAKKWEQFAHCDAPDNGPVYAACSNGVAEEGKIYQCARPRILKQIQHFGPNSQ